MSNNKSCHVRQTLRFPQTANQCGVSRPLRKARQCFLMGIQDLEVLLLIMIRRALSSTAADCSSKQFCIQPLQLFQHTHKRFFLKHLLSFCIFTPLYNLISSHLKHKYHKLHILHELLPSVLEI